MNEPRLTSAEVAALVKKSRRTVHRAVEDGLLIPQQKLPGKNGAFLFTEEAVKRYRDSLTSAA